MPINAKEQALRIRPAIPIRTRASPSRLWKPRFAAEHHRRETTSVRDRLLCSFFSPQMRMQTAYFPVARSTGLDGRIWARGEEAHSERKRIVGAHEYKAESPSYFRYSGRPDDVCAKRILLGDLRATFDVIVSRSALALVEKSRGRSAVYSISEKRWRVLHLEGILDLEGFNVAWNVFPVLRIEGTMLRHLW